MDASDVNNLKGIKKSHEYTVRKAHGVLWHGGKVWAIGEKYLDKYDVVGKGKDIELKSDAKPISLSKVPGRARNGHDLSASYKDDDILLLTHTAAAYKYNTTSGDFDTLMGIDKLKSLVQHSSGEYAWVEGGMGGMGQYVSFSDESVSTTMTDKKGWEDAGLYKEDL
ncbi:hypothetical protein N7519_006287 [Penicillium mononematosum]|uniref:uncharacterized protein n=1 Tax=Penicillium mononematosum TaxID=268346 RepID=UPI00254723C4|nr:uncharacterized protein N7519_006287 [Penicillium mononematosum]KAJ6184986.1 hypothetical protein N7519_006287 [Penicillium mononematosum]